MPTDVIMPALGMAQETGKVLRWLKSEGDAVAKGEPLLEIETDKVTVEIEAPADGRLGGHPRGRRRRRAGRRDDRRACSPPARRSPSRPRRRRPRPRPSHGCRVGAVAAGAGAVAPLASPKARRLAAERGIDLAALAGSGPGGAVVAADVDASRDGGLQALRLERLAADGAADDRELAVRAALLPAPRGRRVAARELARAARARPGHERVSHTDLLVKLVGRGAAPPSARELDLAGRRRRRGGAGRTSVSRSRVDDGLVVGVVHDADRLSLAETVARRIELVDAAARGRLRPDDVTGGTFTVSNLGMYGVDSFDAIVNAPQAAILAVGRIVDRIVPVDGQPAVRPTLQLSVSFDHRVVDGARGAEFLDTLASLVEEPAGLVE